MTDQLEKRATALAAHHAAAEAAAAAVDAATARRDEIAERMQALKADRAAIISARAAGNRGADDGARLELAAADLEGLAALLAPAEAALTHATDGMNQANHAAAAAGIEFEREEIREIVLALDQRADELAELLSNTLHQRRAASANLPVGERDFARSVAQLQQMDSIMSGELANLRGVLVGQVAQSFRVVWAPSQFLYEQVWRLHNGGGRLS